MMHSFQTFFQIIPAVASARALKMPLPTAPVAAADRRPSIDCIAESMHTCIRNDMEWLQDAMSTHVFFKDPEQAMRFLLEEKCETYFLEMCVCSFPLQTLSPS